MFQKFDGNEAGKDTRSGIVGAVEEAKLGALLESPRPAIISKSSISTKNKKLYIKKGKDR